MLINQDGDNAFGASSCAWSPTTIRTLFGSPTTVHDWSNPVLEVDLRHDDRWATFSNGDGYYLPNTTKRGDGWRQTDGRALTNQRDP